jgi:hypothetical protein
MESVFSNGGALDLHPDGSNRLQIPKGWRPRKLFEPIISFGDGNTVANLGSTPEDSGFGRLKGKDSRRSRSGGGKGSGGSRKRQFDDVFSTEHAGHAPNLPVDEDKEDSHDGVQYRDDITPEEDPDDLLLYLDGIQGVDNALWIRWGNKSLPPYCSKLTPSGFASGRGDSSSKKAFSLGWGRIPRDLASQASCMATLISTLPSPSAYAVALCHLYYTHDSNTAQSLLAFVNAAARKYITSLDLGAIMSPELLGEDIKNVGDRLFQPDDKRPYQRLIRALIGHGGGRYRGLYLQHISFVANELTELFKDEVIGSLNEASTTTREGESVRRQNAREYLFETFGFNHEVSREKSLPASAWKDVVFHLLRAILLSSPTVKDFCRIYRMWLLVFLNQETPTFSTAEQIWTQSCHHPSPLVSSETSDSAVSLIRVLLIIIGKPACYFTGTRECDDVAEAISIVMTFSTDIILSSIGFGAIPVSSETNFSNGGCVASLAKAAVTGIPEKEKAVFDIAIKGKYSWPTTACSDAVRSLFSSSLSNLSFNKYCSRLLADLFLSADDGRRHFVNVLSEIETRTIDDGNDKASCVLNRAIECQLHMFLGRSALSLDEKSKLCDQMPQDVSSATLLRLIQESPSCESFSPSFNDGINSNPLQAHLDDFALWIENSCQEFNSRWSNSDEQTWSTLQFSPNLGQLRRCIGGGTVQMEDEINERDKEIRFKLREDVIVEPYDTICATKPLSHDAYFPSPSSSPRLSSIARLPLLGYLIFQSSSAHLNLQCLAEEMRVSLRTTHRPLSQMMSHFFLLLSCVTRRMSAKLNAYLNAFYGVSINKDSIQEFNNRVLSQAIMFLRPIFPLTSKMSLIRNLALSSQAVNGSENFTILLNSSREAAVNDLQTIGNLSLTAPSSLHFLHSLVNVQSTIYDSFDRVFEVISNDESLPFIKAQTIYTLKARVLQVLPLETKTRNKSDEKSINLLLAFAHGLLSSPIRQRIQRRYVQLPVADSKRHASASKTKEYIYFDCNFDENEAFRGKSKDSMKGDGVSDGQAKIDKKDQLTKKSVKFISIQTSPSKEDSLLISCREKEKKDEIAPKTRYEALTAQREKTSNDEALHKARYENIQKVRVSTDQASKAPPSQQNPVTFVSGTSSPPSVLLSNTSALPIPPKNQSYSAECKSCTFELEYTLNDTYCWICGIPITCRVCDNLIAFCCDDEKCNKFNYVTSNLTFGPTQSLVCFACKKPFGSTQVVDNCGQTTSTSNPSSSAYFSATPSAAASSALSAGSSSVLTRATPPAAAPARIILTLPLMKRTEKASIPGPSTVCSSSTQMTTQSIATSQLIPSIVSYPLLVSETDAGRLVSLRARTSQLLEKKKWETV